MIEAGGEFKATKFLTEILVPFSPIDAVCI